jgi:ankyrin repeat protein
VHAAASGGSSECVSVLLDRGANGDATDASGRTPLRIAVQGGHDEAGLAVLAAGVKAEYADFVLALTCGCPRVVGKILQSSAGSEFLDGESSPLEFAADAAMAKLLVEAGVRPTSGALTAAIARGAVEVAEVLISAGVDGLEDALVKAAGAGVTELISVLLEVGTQPSALGTSGTTPVHAASKREHAEIVALLLEAGADVNARDSSNWRTPLQEASRKGQEEVVSLLLDGGAEVDAKDGWGRTPRGEALQKGHLSVVELLEAAGATEAEEGEAEDPNSDCDVEPEWE